MTEYIGSGPVTERSLVRELRALGRATAPPSLLGDVQTLLGLADAYTVLQTPLGPVYVAYNNAGVSSVMQAASAAEFEQLFASHFRRTARPAAEPPRDLLTAMERQLRGERSVALRFDLSGLSEFEQAVLRKALEIPRGEVRPYAWIAREIGRPKAVRAVGSALARNPIPLLIPCHRVVRSDGYIGNYALGGAPAKRSVLAQEGVAPEDLERLAGSGARYIGSDTTRIYCFPTCRHARRIEERHRVPFASDTAAAMAGYRPCRVCRPAATA